MSCGCAGTGTQVVIVWAVVEAGQVIATYPTQAAAAAAAAPGQSIERRAQT